MDLLKNEYRARVSRSQILKDLRIIRVNVRFRGGLDRDPVRLDSPCYHSQKRILGDILGSILGIIFISLETWSLTNSSIYCLHKIP